MNENLNVELEERSLRDEMHPFSMAGLVPLVMKRKHMSMQDALAYIVSSRTYQLMLREQTKMWYESDEALYDMVEKEKRKGRKTEVSEELMLFHMFCFENYRLQTNYSATRVLELFNQYDVFGFLARTFDVLHTQAPDYIIDSIKVYLKKRGHRK